MTPLTAFASSYWKSGPALLERYNGAPSFEIDGQAAPGYSSGTALKAMEELAKENLPAGVGYSWTNLSYEEAASARSEEHTSELQSLMRISYAVFCLKTKTNRPNTIA